MVRCEISDEAWAVIGPLLPAVRATGRPPVDRRMVVEATAWRYRAGAPWRDVAERFGNWNTIYKNFNRWSEQGVWARVLEKVHPAHPLPRSPCRRTLLPQVDGIAMRTDKTARNYHAAICLAATLHWV